MTALSPELLILGTEDLGLIEAADSVVFFGGAGVSTESGVPDFRSADGIYAKVRGAESILTLRFLRQEPEAFYTFYREYFMTEDIRPNVCHELLATLEADGRLDCVITQNVDGLHQAAGSRNVLELHGTGHRFSCLSCGSVYDDAAVRAMDRVPHCTCGGLLRPDIIFYEEGLDGAVMEQALRAIRDADLLIIAGTSLTVYPAAGFVHLQKRQGRKLLIDRTARPFPGIDRHRAMNLGDWSRAVLAAMAPTP